MPISAGSFSRLSVYEECNYRAQLAFIDRVPEPDRGPLPPGKTEWPDKRGIRVHEESNNYLVGAHPDIPEEAKMFKPEMKQLRALMEQDRVVAEETWGFDKNWNIVPWNDWENCKFRIKTDATVLEKPKMPSWALTIDFKTGKVFGNEVKHAEQMELYALGSFIKYPTIKTCDVELWYFDQNDLKKFVLKKREFNRMQMKWDKRNAAMLNATDFPPNPNIHTCRFCPYHPKKGGPCSVGV